LPIVFVHGVSVRDDKGWEQLEILLRRYIAPLIADDAAGVTISRCYWGDFGAKFRFGGASIPNSPIMHLLKNRPLATFSKAQLGKIRAVSQRLLKDDETGKRRLFKSSHTEAQSEFKMSRLTEEDLSNLLAQAVITNSGLDSEDSAIASLAADEVAHEADTFEALAKCDTRQEEIQLLRERVAARYLKLKGHVKSSKSKLPVLRDSLLINMLESVARTAHGAGFVLTRAAAEARSPINQFVTSFIGDVFAYLTERGDASAPGWIPATLLAALAEAHDIKVARGGEPLIVMSHSMGGQIVYDAVTHFLPRLPEYQNLKVDFWCACASQVGLFEELKLFLESDNRYGIESGDSVPYPPSKHLGYWWNVWDHNDFVSYSTKSIIADVDDEAYTTGMALVSAHSGYLTLPSFFRRFQKKLKKAKQLGWQMAAGDANNHGELEPALLGELESQSD
jgi:hypothetical protein